MIRRKAKRIQEGQARERKKEGEPAHFVAHVIRTRFIRKTGLVRRVGLRADLATPPQGTQHKKLGKLRVSQDRSN